MALLLKLDFGVIKTEAGKKCSMKFIEKIGTNGRKYKFRDLSGLKIGSYTILHRGKDRYSKTRRSMMWTSQCECGNINDLDISNIIGAIKKLQKGEIKIFSCGCKSSLPFGISAAKSVYRQYKVHAATRGYLFNVSWDDFLNITKQNCYYCGTSPNNSLGRTDKKRGNGRYTYNGMDRKDNTKGYFLDNVVPCCKRCNRAKDVMNSSEFLTWIEKVHSHSLKRSLNNIINHSFGHTLIKEII